MGPIVEPRLSPNQAAKRGGQCGPNITRVTQHLSATPRPPTAPGPSWAALLGQHHAVVEEYIERIAATLGDAPCAAVIFCAQNKAFERISLQWVDALLQRWRLPS
eukprot:1970125-Pyramimonas_sp.AAC.1